MTLSTFFLIYCFHQLVSELRHHEKLLQHRVHVTDAAKVSNANKTISGLALLAHLDLYNFFQIFKQNLWLLAPKFIGD